MAPNPISIAVDLALAPSRLALRAARGLIGGQEPAPPPPPPPPPPAPPKDLDDVTIARKVESIVFRGRKVAKGKVDVNVADGVVWLRGEVKTPNLIKDLEARAREVPEVRGVENLLHLPKTPAPTRTDTPASQRKSRRTKPRSANTKLMPSDVTGEAPAPVGSEPTPRAASATRRGRRPAPLGSEDPDDLDNDPAYNPTDPGLKDLKGG
jgi:BON domain